MRVAFEIGGDQGILVVFEDVLHGARGGLLERRVDGIPGGRLIRLDDEIDERDVGRGHADGDAVELSLELRYHEPDRLRGAGRRGDHVDCGRARAAQVGMGKVEELLVVRIGMDGGHQALLDPEILQEDLRNRSEAVRGAGGVGDDVMLRRIVGGIVTSGLFAGALITTFRAPLVRCCLAASPSVKCLSPVDSMTMSTPRSFQGNFVWSFSESTFSGFPFTMREPSLTSTLPEKFPTTESCFKR